MFRSTGLISLALTVSFAAAGTAQARPTAGPQVCTLGITAVGQPGAIICKDSRNGSTTQRIVVGNAVVTAGGTGGTFSHHGNHVLVTNIAGSAALFDEVGGRLIHPVVLQTGGENSLSGALDEHGAYVLTATRVLYFPNGHSVATSSARLALGDGSAAQVAVSGGYAYVSEKNGSLEALALRGDGNMIGSVAPVTGIPAGAIVGITGLEDLVVSPVAHLATNANQSTVPVSSGKSQVQIVPTKEVAACWAANEDGEVCISNPGSMTVSCGRFGAGGFTSYTSAAANPVGESLFDIDMRHGIVGILGTHSGAQVLMVYARSEGDDFLTSLGEIPVGTTAATGSLVLPPPSL